MLERRRCPAKRAADACLVQEKTGRGYEAALMPATVRIPTEGCWGEPGESSLVPVALVGC